MALLMRGPVAPQRRRSRCNGGSTVAVAAGLLVFLPSALALLLAPRLRPGWPTLSSPLRVGSLGSSGGRALLGRTQGPSIAAVFAGGGSMEDGLGEEVTNVFGGALEPCSTDPLTGWFRDGYCRTDGSDQGRHLLCVQTTVEFLEHQVSIGNDLSTPMPMYGFPGLKPGDSWCVCASRWAEAVVVGVNAPVRARATNAKALDFAPEETLRRLAIDAPAAGL
mmetsp:Transcript_114798/g.245045  ORF Transcript_114798/g.245045 Transcript_114798/m.245045 type:complete len:221 (+) Transcript_114798:38-700(+)